MPLPSAAQIIHSRLKAFKHDNWGGVIYWCTYDDDAAWVRFKELVEKDSRESIAESDAPEAADCSLKLRFV